LGWVQIFALVLGSVGLAQSADGLGWIESHKMDPWTTLCWVYATVEEAVRPSHQSTATTVASGFAAERPASRRYRSTAAGAALQAPALSSKCGQRHAESRRRRLNTNLFCQQIDMVTSACEILYDNTLYKFTLHYITLRASTCNRSRKTISNE